MRYVEIELESARKLPLGIAVSAIAMPAPDTLIVCSGEPPRLLSLQGDRVRELNLDAPGFIPRFLVDADGGRVLAIGDGENSGVLFDATGALARRYNLGEGIVDAAYDPDGNIVVLRGAAPLLDRYGPDGDLVDSEQDAQIRNVHAQTQEEGGSMLLIGRDGSLWLNLREVFDTDGDVLARWREVPEGRIAADLFGWDGVVILSESGVLQALTSKGEGREVRVPSAQIEKELGRGPSAASDIILTREERLFLIDTDGQRLLEFRILSE